jgi:hypothetical protein
MSDFFVKMRGESLKRNVLRYRIWICYQMKTLLLLSIILMVCNSESLTHDPEIANRADRKIVLKDGLIVEDTLPSPDHAEVVVQSERANG